MMELSRFQVVFGVCLIFVTLSAGELCTSPQVASTFFSTSDAQVSSETVFVVEFTLACENDAKDINLHAELNGKTLAVTRDVDSNKYQVSLSGEHKKLPKGSYTLRLFDDEQFTDLRKAQRTGETTSAVKSLYEINLNHLGTSRGPWIQTEHIAASAICIIAYLAHSLRNQLQS